jgi:hypothetical protein
MVAVALCTLTSAQQQSGICAYHAHCDDYAVGSFKHGQQGCEAEEFHVSKRALWWRKNKFPFPSNLVHA